MIQGVQSRLLNVVEDVEKECAIFGSPIYVICI